jgi:acyl-CoA synthetase (AMP-forming)/AMP-acid ligase II
LDNLIAVSRPALTSTAAPPSTVVDALLGRVADAGARPAFTYLAHGEEASLTQSFADIDRQARAVAALLRREDCQPGERALLLYPPGEADFIPAFLGCLYAGVVAVPVPPPHPARLSKVVAGAQSQAAAATRVRRTLAKVLAIAADSRPAVVLTTQTIGAAFASASAEFEPLRRARWLATDGLRGEDAVEWERPLIEGSSLAFLQYTSGSTATPKGVMITHDHLLYNARYIQQGYGQGPDDVLVSWLPAFHDMGLIFGILQSLYTGMRAYLMPPASFIQRPVRWLRAISRYGCTHSAAPNFAYDLCVRKATAEDIAALDLSRWRHAYNGAEPVRKETLERFAATFAPCGFRPESFYPVYGLAEATLLASGVRGRGLSYYSFDVRADALERHRVVAAEARATGAASFGGAAGDNGERRNGEGAGAFGGVDRRGGEVRTRGGCGETALDTRVRIVNPETCAPCAPDEVGEVWVSSPAVGGGYWNLPELSEQIFRARLAGGHDDGLTYLRTGDLGFLAGAQLVITGRHKDLLIVGGANHYPQDIELTAERSHPELRSGGAAAFAVEVGGAEQVVVAVEVGAGRGTNGGDARPSAQELAVAVRSAVAEEHEIQVHRVVLLKAGGIPKTSSGKTQRRACRDLFLAGKLPLWE